MFPCVEGVNYHRKVGNEIAQQGLKTATFIAQHLLFHLNDTMPYFLKLSLE